MEDGNVFEGKEWMNKIKNNPWILASVVLAVVVVILAILVLRGGSSISVDKAGENSVDLIGKVFGVDLVYNNGEEVDGLYNLNFTLDNETLILKATKDFSFLSLPNGQWLRVADYEDAPAIDNTDNGDNTPASTSVPKSDKPKVELFVWGYCPYGVQAQGPMVEVAKLLKNSADFSAVMYYDGHGAYETQQNKIQECIQRDYKDKYWDYAAKFVSDVYPACSSARTEECDKTESTKVMTAVGIDSTKVFDCVSKDGASLIAAASARASSLGVTGSPSIVINGVIAQPSARTADAFKDSVCTAFNTAPGECSTALSSAAGAAAGNC